MKNVKQAAFQGELFFIKVDSLPEDAKEAEGNIVGHSETGHHHVATGANVSRYTTSDPLTDYIVGKSIQIEHLREFDTHETLNLLNDGEGEVIWKIRRQREHTPDGWRRVED